VSNTFPIQNGLKQDVFYCCCFRICHQEGPRKWGHNRKTKSSETSKDVSLEIKRTKYVVMPCHQNHNFLINKSSENVANSNILKMTVINQIW